MSDSSQRKRAKYITSSSPPPPKEPIDAFAFCESSLATSHANWHIRRLDEKGLKRGGGITTPSLCGLVQPRTAPRGFGGWDLDGKVTDHHLKHACRRCVAEYLKLRLKPGTSAEADPRTKE